MAEYVIQVEAEINGFEKEDLAKNDKSQVSAECAEILVEEIASGIPHLLYYDTFSKDSYH